MKDSTREVLARAVPIAAVVTIICTVLVVVITTNLYVRLAAEADQDRAARIEDSFQTCLRGNQSRASRRAERDSDRRLVAIDLEAIPNIDGEPALHVVLVRLQDAARDRLAQAENDPSLRDRDCEAERDQQRQTGTVPTTVGG